MTLGSERGAVQNPFIRYAAQAGWTYLPPEETLRLRRGENGLVLHDVLADALQRLNPGVVDAARAEELVGRVARVPATIEGNLQAWEFLKGLKTVFVDEERRERNVAFLDAERPERNALHVTEEFRYAGGPEPIRADVVLLVNGIPVLIVETKSATHKDGIAEALDQIRRYHREGPELLAQAQLHALTHLLKFYYGATWNLSRQGLFNWREEAAGDFETLVKLFVHPRRLLRVLADFILFTRKDDDLAKVVLRPHQMRAVDRIGQRARDPKKRRGLVWHTQGSGKTYTMISVAKDLIADASLKHPTVLLLVDRNELESQLFRNLKEVGLGEVPVADSKRDLQALLGEGRRGLIVSMIHKFEGMPANVCERDNVFVLVDEAHRTTGGDLGNYLMGALPNATYIGFTGTPIDRTAHGKGTFKVFGVDDQPKGYLDKYSIKESIQDGTTVPLHYALAPNELLVDRETLEREFLDLAAAEGVSDVEELNRVLDRAVTLKNELKSPDRVAKVAAFVAKHFAESVKPMGYKAFLVAVDREACVRYKRALDTLLPPEQSAVVFSPAHNDRAELAAFHLTEEEEKRIRTAFRKHEGDPQILIVTEKLLTGFDAPILYCMYLDKPMRDHVLLQAIARVNRPLEDEAARRRKTAGLIIDFVGVFAKLEKALAFDSEDIEGVIEDLGILKTRFGDVMEHGRRTYLPIGGGKHGDKQVEAVLEHFRDKELRQAFYKWFRELEELYEILSPDAFLRPFLSDYDEIVRLYRIVRAAYDPTAMVDRSFLRKTAELVQKHTTAGKVSDLTPVHPLNAETLARLAAEKRPDTVKVFNLLNALMDLVDLESGHSPYLIPIGERAEQVARAFEERHKSAEEALEELKALVREVRDAEASREASELSPEAFAVFWLLRRDGVKQAEPVAKGVGEAFARFPHWRTSEKHEREVRRQLYKVMLKNDVEGPETVVERVLTILRRAQ